MPGGTRSYEFARRLVSMGHIVNMVTSWRENVQGAGWYTTIEAGITVHWLPVKYSNHMSYINRIKAFFTFAFASSLRAASIRSDIIFATSTPLTIALPAIYASHKLKVPMVFEVRDLWPELPIAIGALRNPLAIAMAKRLESLAYRNSTAIVALSPGIRMGILKSRYPSSRIAVIPNSSDNREFSLQKDTAMAWRKNRPWLGNRPLLVYAGAFGKINGVGYLVRIAIHLKNLAPNIRILLIGDGSEKEAIISYAKASQVFGINLFIENKIPKRDIPVVFAASDMLSSLFIDIKEMQSNSANKFFDALAAGKPVLINYGGWQAELISKAKCGIVTCRNNDWHDAAVITKFLLDKNWLLQAGHNAKQLALELFDRDILATQLASVLTNVNQKQIENNVANLTPQTTSDFISRLS